MMGDPRLGEVFLAGLPKMFKVHVAKEPSGQWREQSIRFSVNEGNGQHAGSGLVLAKLSELLFVETLQRTAGGTDGLAGGCARPCGWAGAGCSAQGVRASMDD